MTAGDRQPNIPPELLSDVFVLLKNSGYDPTISPTSVAGVCRYWRDVAIGNPQLWSAVRIQATGRRLRTGQLELAKLRFKRSCHSPLTLVLRMNKFFPELVDLIVPTSPRWRELRLEGPLAFYRALDCVQGKLPWLTSCDFRLGQTKRDSKWRTHGPWLWKTGMFKLLLQAPNIRHLSIGPEFASSLFSIPCEQLELCYFTVTPVTLEDALKSPTLTTLGVRSSGISTPPPPRTPPSPNPTITELYLSCPPPYLDYLPDLPSLQRLTFEWNERELNGYTFRGSGFNALGAFCARVGSTVKYLAFSSDLENVRFGLIRQCLQHLVNIHFLRLTFKKYPIEDWEPLLSILALNESTEGSPVAPRLHTLRIRCMNQTNPQQFIPMLASRGWHMPPVNPSNGTTVSLPNSALKVVQLQWAHSIALQDVEGPTYQEMVDAYHAMGLSFDFGHRRDSPSGKSWRETPNVVSCQDSSGMRDRRVWDGYWDSKALVRDLGAAGNPVSIAPVTTTNPPSSDEAEIELPPTQLSCKHFFQHIMACFRRGFS